MILRRSLVLAFALLTCGPAQAGHQILACIVATLEGNTHYYGTATTATRLRCELTKPDVYPTLAQLYAEGWRLIQVVGGNHAIAMGNNGPSPLYLLEREVQPPRNPPPPQNLPATPEHKGR